jgi:hypothetical protein
MVISLLTLIMLTMVTTLFIARTKTETQIAGHDMRATQALFNAEAGYGEVLARMSKASDKENYIGQQAGDWNTDPGWGRYLVLSEGNSKEDPSWEVTQSDGVDNDSDGTTDEDGERYPEVKSKQSGEDAINYPWVQVRNKLDAANQVILFGDHDNNLATLPRPNVVRGIPIIVVTAMGGQGSSNRTIEVEAVKVPIQVVQTAVYSESDEFKFNGTQFLVSGQDWDPVTGAPILGNPEVPGMSTTEDTDNITDALAANQENNLEGEGAEPSVSDSNVDLDLDALASQLQSSADLTIGPGDYSNLEITGMGGWGGYDDYKTIYATGAIQVSGNNQGGGVLIVDGDFKLTGQFTWYGLVIVLGDLSVSGGGSGIHIFGSTLVQGGGGFGGTLVGGNADLLYSSAALARLASLSPYTVFNWREMN